ncbi:MAG TPA: serine protease [Nitrososphaera sp.]|nr:serine protease [Nitrososphaera sp.]
MEESPALDWYQAVEVVNPYVVKISTPRGFGTGFLIARSKTDAFCAIATAAHVVDFAHYWEEPIRIDHPSSRKSTIVRQGQRAIFLDPARDTAAILFNRGDIPLPDKMLPLGPNKMVLKVGIEIGWLGFPAIAGADLCFFSGRVSSWVQAQEAYLVDGVAVNGVSGGPAFHLDRKLVILMGVVSAYAPNRATGETLPGLGVIRNVTQFHELAPTFESLDQAISQQTPPSVPPSPPPKHEEGVQTIKRNP